MYQQRFWAWIDWLIDWLIATDYYCLLANLMTQWISVQNGFLLLLGDRIFIRFTMRQKHEQTCVA
jgi:hypothetical protein